MNNKPTPKMNDADIESAALINELKEDLRRQKIENIVIDNGGKIISLAVLIVIITSAIYFYNQYILKRNIAAGQKFYEAVETSKTGEDKMKALQGIKAELPKGFASIAELKIADEMIVKENFTEAKKELEAISKNAKYDRAFREIAELKLIDILIKQKENEQDILKRLDALSQADSVFKYSALETKITYFVENERKKDATEIATKIIADKNAPQNIINRVKLLTE